MPAQNPAMYESATAEAALNSCYGQLLTAIGMAAVYPDRAAQLSCNCQPARRVIRAPGSAGHPRHRNREARVHEPYSPGTAR